MKIACILAAAFLLDCLLGDPRWLPHPICLIGKLIACTEKGMRRLVKNEFLGGLLLVIVVITVSTAVPWAILFLAGMINPWVETVLQVWFCYQILAMKSLRTESMRVYTPLKAGDLPLARKYLSWIVGRETDRLDEEGVAKAAVETVAENTSDGVVAPLIFMAIGGAPLGFLYKAINTMDSMVGYKNDKYIRFGRAAARLDDAANFIPARLSALLMILAVYILRFDGGNAGASTGATDITTKVPTALRPNRCAPARCTSSWRGRLCISASWWKNPPLGTGTAPRRRRISA